MHLWYGTLAALHLYPLKLTPYLPFTDKPCRLSCPQRGFASWSCARKFL